MKVPRLYALVVSASYYGCVSSCGCARPSTPTPTDPTTTPVAIVEPEATISAESMVV